MPRSTRRTSRSAKPKLHGCKVSGIASWRNPKTKSHQSPVQILTGPHKKTFVVVVVDFLGKYFFILSFSLGGFDKIKKSMKGSNADGGESQVETLNSQQTNLKPTNKMKDVTRDDVLRVLHALNDYDVLQVNLASGSSEIRKNFLKLSRAFHPDKCRIDGSKEAFQRVSKAYTNLKKQVS